MNIVRPAKRRTHSVTLSDRNGIREPGFSSTAVCTVCGLHSTAVDTVKAEAMRTADARHAHHICIDN